MPMFYIDAAARFKADPVQSVRNLSQHLKLNYSQALSSDGHEERRAELIDDHNARLSKIALSGEPPQDGSISPAYLMVQLRTSCPSNTVWIVEAVTNAVIASDQIQACRPKSWINCGGGGLGWSGGGALGVKIATQAQSMSSNDGSFVCQIVGDGAYMFSVPSSVYWIAQKYDIPVLTVVLNNKGWNAPRKSLLLVHPNGDGSHATNSELNISFEPPPDYAGIAMAASCHKAWIGRATTTGEVEELIPQAVEAVATGRTAVLDVHLKPASSL